MENNIYSMFSIEEDQKLLSNDGKFIVGKNGYIFINNDTNGVMGQITGKKRFTDRILYSWKNLLENRKKYIQNLGITYLHVSAPSKECVYSDKLPNGIYLSEERPIRQLLNTLVTSTACDILIYPFEELVASRSIRETYPKGDSHWNWFGGYIAYSTIVSRLGIKPIDLAEINFIDIETKSDLAEKLGRLDVVTRAKLLHNKSQLIFNNKVSKIGNLQIYQNEDSSLPTAIIFRDSFTTQLTDFLSQHFSKMILVWQPNIDFSLIELEMPNFVLAIQAERFMIKLPDDLNGLTNAQNVEIKNNPNGVL